MCSHAQTLQSLIPRPSLLPHGLGMRLRYSHHTTYSTFQGLASNVEKPYLRTLFFRVLTLYRLGTSLVFVVDGEAVRLKWAEMERRERGAVGRGTGARGRGAGAGGRGTGAGGRWKRNTGTRSQLNSKIKEVRLRSYSSKSTLHYII